MKLYHQKKGLYTDIFIENLLFQIGFLYNLIILQFHVKNVTILLHSCFYTLGNINAVSIFFRNLFLLTWRTTY